MSKTTDAQATVDNAVDVSEAMAQSELAVVEDTQSRDVVESTIAVLSGANFLATVPLVTQKDKLDALKAVTGAERLMDNIGTEIEIKGWIAQESVLNDGTATVRVVIATPDPDKSYFSTSSGVAIALGNIRSLLGDPIEWEQPVRVVPVQRQARNGYRFMTLEVV